MFPIHARIFFTSRFGAFCLFCQAEFHQTVKLNIAAYHGCQYQERHRHKPQRFRNDNAEALLESNAECHANQRYGPAAEQPIAERRTCVIGRQEIWQNKHHNHRQAHQKAVNRKSLNATAVFQCKKKQYDYRIDSKSSTKTKSIVCCVFHISL